MMVGKPDLINKWIAKPLWGIEQVWVMWELACRLLLLQPLWGLEQVWGCVGTSVPPLCERQAALKLPSLSYVPLEGAMSPLTPIVSGDGRITLELEETSQQRCPIYVIRMYNVYASLHRTTHLFTAVQEQLSIYDAVIL